MNTWNLDKKITKKANWKNLSRTGEQADNHHKITSCALESSIANKKTTLNPLKNPILMQVKVVNNAKARRIKSRKLLCV